MSPKMNFIRSQPGGGCGTTMLTGHNKQQHHQRVPPVKLHLDVDPPILDTMEQPGHNMHCAQSNGKPRSQGGRTLLRTLYQRFSKVWAVNPTVTWVTPEVLVEPQCPPYNIFPHMLPQYTQATVNLNSNAPQTTRMPDNPNNSHNTKTLNPDAPLWYPANEGGSQLHLMDPLWQEKGNHIYHEPIKLKKPLNPEAKEWVPKNYYNSFQNTSEDDDALGVYVKSDNFSSCSDGQVPIIPYTSTDPIISKVSHDYCEITEDEVSAVRKNTSDYSPSTKKDEKSGVRSGYVTGAKEIYSSEPECSSTKVSISDKPYLSENTKKIPGNMKTKIFSENANHREEEVVAECVATNGCGREKQSMSERKASPCSEDAKVSCCNHVNDSSSFSYANIVGRPSSSPPPHWNDGSHDALDKYGKVIQPLPKIFLKDKKYPKEKAGLCVESKSKNPGLFKTVSKSQKATSKNFLKDLKSSPLKSQNNENSDFIISVGLSFSPETSISCSPKSDTSSLLGSPASTDHKAPHSWTDCTSSNHRDRTASESSVTSLESVDIEFGEAEMEIKCISDNITACKKMSNNIQTPKGNSFLACILGGDESDSDDSDSEEEDDDFDSEWDKVCIETNPNDDTWEIFGFGLYLPDHRDRVYKKLQQNTKNWPS
ncbi:hypothetical protein Pcinc_018093 [Petrolisthes cinctipes]|uniref:Uncharacterized protein n=1 Tax=Petrolisthes cinctipes TaxID=88211 RepID=A0AAE1KJP2_PETCI|nr:hypothetical protein Pcinc_018093 [Petrolisthes cinctipes]